MRYSKVLEVKSPSRVNPTDAGIDFFIPEKTIDFIEAYGKANNILEISQEFNPAHLVDSGIMIPEHSRVLIPSGIKVDVPSGYMLMAANKSGVAVKKGLIFGAEIVDEPYQGVVHISLINTNPFPIKISYGEKIVQFILVPVNYSMPEEVPLEDLYSSVSSRGAGAMGSTGTR